MKQTAEHTVAKKLSLYPYIFLSISCICLVLAIVLSFNTAHTIHHQRHFPVPRQTNVDLIQSWMTIRYVSRTYDIPPEVFSQKLAIDTQENAHVTLHAIAQQKKENVSIVIHDVQTIIKEFQATHPVPPTTNN